MEQGGTHKMTINHIDIEDRTRKYRCIQHPLLGFPLLDRSFLGLSPVIELAFAFASRLSSVELMLGSLWVFPVLEKLPNSNGLRVWWLPVNGLPLLHLVLDVHSCVHLVLACFKYQAPVASYRL